MLSFSDFTFPRKKYDFRLFFVFKNLKKIIHWLFIFDLLFSLNRPMNLSSSLPLWLKALPSTQLETLKQIIQSHPQPISRYLSRPLADCSHKQSIRVRWHRDPAILLSEDKWAALLNPEAQILSVDILNRDLKITRKNPPKYSVSITRSETGRCFWFWKVLETKPNLVDPRWVIIYPGGFLSEAWWRSHGWPSSNKESQSWWYSKRKRKEKDASDWGQRERRPISLQR